MEFPPITLLGYRNQVDLTRLGPLQWFPLGPPRWRVNAEKEFP